MVASATEEHASFVSPQIGWAEQQPDDWWAACTTAVPRALECAGLQGDDIACLGFSGQMHGAVMLDESGRVVRPALIWCDVRTDHQCRELTEKIRSGTAHPVDLQSRSAQLHADQVPVGARKRTGQLEAGSLGHAAERLCSLPTHRGSRHRHGGCFRDSVAGCAAATGLKAGTPVVAGAGDQAAGARGAFVGLTASHTRADVIRAILEGVASSLRDPFSIFGEMSVPVKSVRLGGGGARSALWRQIQADVYGHEVEMVEAEEGAAYGAALLAGVGARMWPSVDEACASVVRVAKRVRPNADALATLNKNYAAYRRVYRATRDVFAD